MLSGPINRYATMLCISSIHSYKVKLQSAGTYCPLMLDKQKETTIHPLRANDGLYLLF